MFNIVAFQVHVSICKRIILLNGVLMVQDHGEHVQDNDGYSMSNGHITIGPKC